MDSSILITGGKGFIGNHLNKIFPEAKIYDLKDGQDILDYVKLKKALNNVDIVIHLAALISVSDSLKHPGKYYSTNIAGTDNVIRAAIEAGCKTIIFASSAAVYAPDNPYGLSKKIGEDLMSEYKDKIQTISLRFFNIYGPGQNPEYAGVISKFLDAAKKGKPLVVYGDGTQTRDFINVFDVVKIIDKILIRKKQIASGSVLEMGTGKSISINRLARYLSKKYNVPLEYLPNKDMGIFKSKADNKIMMSIIGGHYFNGLFDSLTEII